MIAFIFVYNSMPGLALLQEAQTDFNDLGKLLLGGVAAAVVFALAFSFVRLRLREKSPQTSNFISISAAQNSKDEVRDS